MLEKVLPNAMLKAKPNLESRIRTLKKDWSIVYDMLSGKNNSGFGWDEHRQLVVTEDAVHKEAAQFRHRSFPYDDQLTGIYTKDRATGKDAQIVADIIEKIDVEDVATTNTHEERNDFHGCEANVSLDDMDLSTTQPQPARNQGDFTLSKKKKKISDASDSCTSFNDASTLLAENIWTVGLEISKSIDSEVLTQQKSEMTIQESALKLYPTLCEVEGLTEDEHYRALSKIPNHPTQMIVFFKLPSVVGWNGSEDFLLNIKNHGCVDDILITFCACNIWMV
ncbi:Chaperone DnaK [Gossypium arboreum]|uniref:Chaperone DnaK n=1 Tax=Gossypium arboreum TaxID=29729 RepID=A0A0B0MCZ8_GOSAR|nr:Chaperone DnaK [Gossypium arboreum]